MLLVYKKDSKKNKETWWYYILVRLFRLGYKIEYLIIIF
jgi:hypothetical protein